VFCGELQNRTSNIQTEKWLFSHGNSSTVKISRWNKLAEMSRKRALSSIQADRNEYLEINVLKPAGGERGIRTPGRAFDPTTV
jgi:hypothetical protein